MEEDNVISSQFPFIEIIVNQISAGVHCSVLLVYIHINHSESDQCWGTLCASVRVHSFGCKYDLSMFHYFTTLIQDHCESPVLEYTVMLLVFFCLDVNVIY